ncbi:MCE family protein [Nocardioides sp. SYSU D00038]|uniref:MCE family protein n=1 Tax=Nocardioides sp. SYSU D00038 TaxID=2812554 RepID=UPI001967BE45|nr:MCE family protein [Nocardioides sp. SYSU D00038]
MAASSVVTALRTVPARVVVVAVAVALLVGLFFVVREPAETRTVTAHFPRAVSVYVGTDVRILGVNVGRVTAVVPEGNSVRVEMEYDAEHPVPADAKAAIVTPTLVADRFVQLTPAYSGGPKLADGADIALPDTGVPVELDRIYASLRDLSEALGPNGVNADGTLDNLLRAGAEGLGGQGERGHEMITRLSEAAETFGEGSGPLFDTVTELATFTSVLAENDELVRAFIKDLAGVSASLVSERVELQKALASVSRAVGTVEQFVKGNRTALVRSVERLTRVAKTIGSERESLDQALRTAPVAIGNLTVAYNNATGTIGSRIGVQGNVWDADGLLCAIVQQAPRLPRPTKDLACNIFKRLLEPVLNQVPEVPPPYGRSGAGRGGGGGSGTANGGGAGGAAPGAGTERYVGPGDASLSGLLGGTP